MHVFPSKKGIKDSTLLREKEGEREEGRHSA
jgi:hypothetical protein